MSSHPLRRGRTSPLGDAGAQLAQVGHRLRVAREERGMTIASVAEFTGLTKGFLSQVERGLASASVTSLAAICDALNLPMGKLFEPPQVYVSRAAEREPTRLIGTGLTDAILSPPGQAGMQVIETIVEPGGHGDPEPYGLPVEREFVVVLGGALVLNIESVEHELGEGDAVSFNARLAHTWRNASDEEPCRVLWVLSSPG